VACRLPADVQSSSWAKFRTEVWRARSLGQLDNTGNCTRGSEAVMLRMDEWICCILCICSEKQVARTRFVGLQLHRNRDTFCEQVQHWYNRQENTIVDVLELLNFCYVGYSKLKIHMGVLSTPFPRLPSITSPDLPCPLHFFPSLHSSLSFRSRTPLFQLGSLEECCKLPQRGSSLVHSSLKTWHLRINCLVFYLWFLKIHNLTWKDAQINFNDTQFV